MDLLAVSARIACWSLVAGMLVMAPGCGEDKKPDPTPATVEAKPPEAAKPPELAAKPAEPAAKPATAEAPKAPEPTTPPAPSAPPTVATSPASGPAAVIAVGGTPSLDALFKLISEVGNKVQPGVVPPGFVSVALEGLKGKLGLSDVSWIKTDQPVKMLLLDPKAFGEGLALVVPIADKDKALASLPATAKKDDPAHAAILEPEPGDQAFLDFVEGHLVLASHPGAFAAVKGYVESELKAWSPSAPIAVDVNLEAIQRIFGADIQQAKGALDALMAAVNAQGGGAMGSGPAGQALAKAQIELFFGVLESSARALVTLSSRDSDVEYGVALTPKPGTGLAKATEAMAGKTSSLASLVPATSWMGVAAHLDLRGVESLKELQKLTTRSYAEILKLDEASVAKIDALFGELWQQSTGEQGFGIYTDGSFPLAMVGGVTVTDAVKARDQYGQLIDMFFVPAVKLLQEKVAEEGGGAPPPIDLSTVKTFDDAVKAVAPLLKTVGVTLSVTRDGDLAGLSVAIDWSNPVLQDPEVQLIKAMIGSKLEAGMVFKGNRLAFAFGPNGYTAAKAAAEGPNPSADPQLARLSQGAALAFVFSPANIGLALKSLAAIPELQAFQAVLEKLAKDRVLWVSGKSDGKSMTFTTGVPMDVIATLVPIFAGIGEAPAPPL
jgi:hypothetical protein